MVETGRRPRIVLVGGGSVLWTPRILRDMLLTDSIAGAEYVLYDISLQAAERTKAVCDLISRRIGSDALIGATDSLAEAMDGADYIVITISTGGLDAMHYDLSIPEEYGIYHTVGDTSGPGGWARGIRNFGAFVDLAAGINRYAPGAVVLNYSNPMATLTDVLSRLCTGPVVGLCHGLFENLEKMVTLYGLGSEDELAVHYGGLNHFFWTTRAYAGDIDIVADLNDRIAGESLTSIFGRACGDPEERTNIVEVADSLIRDTGVIPYFGDRHTCEFFPWYITNRETMERFRIVRTSIEDRRKRYADIGKRLEAAITDGIPDEFLKRSRETAADIISAHATGGTFIDVGNLPNTGQIANLPIGTVVETPVMVTRAGFTPVAFGDLPQPVLGYVMPYAVAYPLLVDACFSGNRKQAFDALRLDPVCSHLTSDRVREMGNKLLKAHAEFELPF